MSELIDYVLKHIHKYVVAFEAPPGIGKTLLTIGKALELARGGATVIYALPTHNALATAFAYAVLSFYEMAKKKRRKLPYLVYYEGINRFCPFFARDGDAVFRYALDYMYARGKVDQVLYERLKDLAVREVATAYGTMFICRNVCPVYRAQKRFPKERVFATENARDIEKQAFPLLPVEVKAYIAEAVKALGMLKKKGLVAYVSPRIEIGKKPDGYCIRAVLQKAVTRKTQIVMKGALILTPIHALDFLHSLVERKIKALQSRGLSVPSPYVIIDEYDFYVYKPAKMPVFSVKQAEKELEVAREVIREEVNKRIANDPSYDWERLVAAMIAVLVLQKLLDEYARFVEEKGSGASLELAGSVANFFAEVATEPVVAGGYVVPPLAPRKISLRPIKETLLQVYSILEEEHDEFVKQHGVSLYDIAAIKKAGLLYFLQLWENVLIIEAKKRGMKFIVPALYKEYGNVYDVGYVYLDKVVSVAKRVAFLAYIRQNYITVIFKAFHVRDVYVEERGVKRKVSSFGIMPYAVSYDPRMMKLFSKDSNTIVLLLSATGLPWHFPFFTTRSMGKGIATPKGRQVAAGTISPVFEGYSVAMSMSKISTDLYIRGPRMRDVLVVTLSPQAILGYAMHGAVVPCGLPLLPNRGTPNYYSALLRCVNEYLKFLLQLVPTILKHAVAGKHPSVLVLTQRKDAAIAFTLTLLHAMKGVNFKAEVCSATTCEPIAKVMQVTKDLNMQELVEKVNNYKASHFVVRVPVKDGRELRFYVTWLRSRMSRGIDLPDDALAYAVLLIGTPYRPPETFDIVPEQVEDVDYNLRGLMIGKEMYIKTLDESRKILLTHIPIDIAESVNEFVQGVGRALRRAWSVTRENSWNVVHRVVIFVAFYTLNKISTYSPLWFRKVINKLTP